MDLKYFIERAEKAAGSQKALGLILGVAPGNLRNAKAGIQGLPAYACVLIAKLIDVPEITVIAASELVTEKKAERRAIFAPFVSKAAVVLIGVVTLNMTPTPANAAPVLDKSLTTLYIMSNCTRWRRAIKKAAFAVIQSAYSKIVGRPVRFAG